MNADQRLAGAWRGHGSLDERERVEALLLAQLPDRGLAARHGAMTPLMRRAGRRRRAGSGVARCCRTDQHRPS